MEKDFLQVLTNSLNLIEFEIVGYKQEDGSILYGLEDLQGDNFGNIEFERYEEDTAASLIVDRLEIYFDHYYIESLCNSIEIDLGVYCDGNNLEDILKYREEMGPEYSDDFDVIEMLSNPSLLDGIYVKDLASFEEDEPCNVEDLEKIFDSKENVIYRVEVGVLLTKEDDEFESYSNVYDKKHGYYDENSAFFLKEEEAVDYAKEYVSEGNNGTYGIVQKFTEEENFDIIKKEIQETDFVEDYYNDDLFSTNSIIFSVAKIDGKMEINFI